MPQLDQYGYAIVTETGIRCGNCHKRHANTETVHSCYRQRYNEEDEIREEIESERRITRFYEEGF